MIAAKLEKWWHEHGSRHDDPEWKKYIARFGELLGTKHVELTTAHTNINDDGKKVFGMSGVGGCTRKAGLGALGYDKEPFTGSTLTTFHIGHILEVMGIVTLEMIGAKLDEIQKKVTLGGVLSSASDGVITELDGCPVPMVLSVKTAGYKMSAKKNGNFIRKGFAELPIDGIKKAQRGWWAQIQAEMAGHKIGKGLVLVVAKDMIKAMEGDRYMIENGSLTFYTEIIDYDEVFVMEHLRPAWAQAALDVDSGTAPPPFVLGPEYRYIQLPNPGDVKNGWNGPNQDATGTFNPCFGCNLVAACTGGG